MSSRDHVHLWAAGDGHEEQRPLRLPQPPAISPKASGIGRREGADAPVAIGFGPGTLCRAWGTPRWKEELAPPRSAFPYRGRSQRRGVLGSCDDEPPQGMEGVGVWQGISGSLKALLQTLSIHARQMRGRVGFSSPCAAKRCLEPTKVFPVRPGAGSTRTAEQSLVILCAVDRRSSSAPGQSGSFQFEKF